jgi:hypothetical protein
MSEKHRRYHKLSTYISRLVDEDFRALRCATEELHEERRNIRLLDEGTGHRRVNAKSGR